MVAGTGVQAGYTRFRITPDVPLSRPKETPDVPASHCLLASPETTNVPASQYLTVTAYRYPVGTTELGPKQSTVSG